MVSYKAFLASLTNEKTIFQNKLLWHTLVTILASLNIWLLIHLKYVG